jgi:hypothetical protein
VVKDRGGGDAHGVDLRDDTAEVPCTRLFPKGTIKEDMFKSFFAIEVTKRVAVFKPVWDALAVHQNVAC